MNYSARLRFGRFFAWYSYPIFSFLAYKIMPKVKPSLDDQIKKLVSQQHWALTRCVIYHITSQPFMLVDLCLFATVKNLCQIFFFSCPEHCIHVKAQPFGCLEDASSNRPGLAWMHADSLFTVSYSLVHRPRGCSDAPWLLQFIYQEVPAVELPFCESQYSKAS